MAKDAKDAQRAPTLKEKIAALEVSRPLKAVLNDLADGVESKKQKKSEEGGS